MARRQVGRPGIWVPVHGFPLYEVSFDGRIRNARTQRELKQHPNEAGGYYRVKLVGESGKKWRFVHLLVLHTFMGGPPTSYHQGCHDDGNKHNNTLPNLLWKTEAENREDKRRHGTMRGCPKGTRKVSNRERKSILWHYAQGESCSAIAKAKNRHRYTISRIVNRYECA